MESAFIVIFGALLTVVVVSGFIAVSLVMSWFVGEEIAFTLPGCTIVRIRYFSIRFERGVTNRL